MDPLEQAREDGFAAAFALLRDTSISRDPSDLVSSISTAAQTDSKFNYHLLEAVVIFALIGWESENQSRAMSNGDV